MIPWIDVLAIPVERHWRLELFGNHIPMSFSIRVNDCTLSGIVSALPAHREGLEELSKRFGYENAAKITNATGIESRHIVRPGQTCADLGFHAAEHLLTELNLDRAAVDLILFVTQTPDYALPGNALILQHRLHLPKSCLAFDVNLGCSGYVYGLWQAAQLLQNLPHGRALLITGDTTSTTLDENDRSVAPLFGDAASATLIERCRGRTMTFNLGSDGAGAPYLIQREGGHRNPGNPRSLFMDGTQVFAFTLREIPKNIRTCLADHGWDTTDLDYAVLHQANAIMLKHIAAKIGLSERQLVIAMRDTGNTSSASIPLAMTQGLTKELTGEHQRLLLSGFGVGWSWGSCALEITPLRACRTILVD